MGPLQRHNIHFKFSCGRIKASRENLQHSSRARIIKKSCGPKSCGKNQPSLNPHKLSRMYRPMRCEEHKTLWWTNFSRTTSGECLSMFKYLSTTKSFDIGVFCGEEENDILSQLKINVKREISKSHSMENGFNTIRDLDYALKYISCESIKREWIIVWRL